MKNIFIYDNCMNISVLWVVRGRVLKSCTILSILLLFFNDSHLLLHLGELLLELLVPVAPHHLHTVLQLLGVVDALLGADLPVEVRYLILKPVNLAARY